MLWRIVRPTVRILGDGPPVLQAGSYCRANGWATVLYAPQGHRAVRLGGRPRCECNACVVNVAAGSGDRRQKRLSTTENLCTTIASDRSGR